MSRRMCTGIDAAQLVHATDLCMNFGHACPAVNSRRLHFFLEVIFSAGEGSETYHVHTSRHIKLFQWFLCVEHNVTQLIGGTQSDGGL